MNYIGIDIGSTCAKTAVLDENAEILYTFVLPTGWSSFETVTRIEEALMCQGIDLKQSLCVSTGYGREAVEAAQKKGKKFGRPAVRIPDDFEIVYYQWKRKEITAVEAMGQLHLSSSTFYRMVGQYESMSKRV